VKKAYLLLADGTLFEGTAVGYEGQSIGEVVFNTGMAGYQEVLTDPSYYGQVVTMTYPLVGNYGINFEDYESRKSWVSGFIMRERIPVQLALQGNARRVPQGAEGRRSRRHRHPPSDAQAARRGRYERRDLYRGL